MAERSRPPALVLVGLMGSGKTTVGKKVAKLLDRRFVDGDVELEARTGRSVAQWFEEDGEEGFRAAEADLLDAVLADCATLGPVVVGAGGGVVVSPRNRTRLAADDVAVVYLHAEPAFLASRTQRKAHRPLLAAGDPHEVLERMYHDRDPLYRSVADAVIEVRPAHDGSRKPKWRLAEQVVEAVADLDLVDPAAARPPRHDQETRP